MASIRCDDYGFDCDYVIMGKVESVIFDYWKHMNNFHGIDYPKGVIERFATKSQQTNSNVLFVHN